MSDRLDEAEFWSRPRTFWPKTPRPSWWHPVKRLRWGRNVALSPFENPEFYDEVSNPWDVSE